MGVLSKAASPVMTSPEPAEKMNGVERRPERLRDWLINQINSGKFRGLEWLDEDKTVFRVPWIHAKKRDYDEERDSALFKEWAMHTGKYKPHENKTIGYDPTTWKINFRCALNGLKDIMELKECQTEWHRVYKVLPSAAKKKRVKGYGVQRSRPYPAITMMPMGGEYTPQEFCDGWNNVNTVYNQYGQAPLLPPNSHYLPTICNTSTAANQYAPTDCATGGTLSPFPTYVSGTIVCPGSCTHSGDEYVEKDCSSHGSPLHSDHGSRSPSHSPHSLSPTAHLGDNSLLPPITTASPQQYHSVPLSSVGSMTDIPVTSSSCPVQQQPSYQNYYLDQIIKEIETSSIMSPTMSPSLLQNEIQVTVLYGSIVVLNETLSCSQGCRIGLDISYDRMLHPDAEKMFGPTNAHQISLPQTHLDARARNILNAMKRGLILTVNNNDIYATALCRATVHHGGSPREDSFPLAKEKTSKVFDYNNVFLPLLEKWNPGEPYPTPYTIFSFGQGWGGGRHVAQNLINVIVTSAQAQCDLRARGIIRRSPSEELNNVPNPFDVYDETHLDELAENLPLHVMNNSDNIPLQQPQGNQRFELPGGFTLPHLNSQY